MKKRFSYGVSNLLKDKGEVFGRIWINDNQYFDNIPLTAWKFYIGGYRPAQKWLKDRRNRELNYENILYYQKVIVAIRNKSINEKDR